jgi:hypothetical protein
VSSVYTRGGHLLCTLEVGERCEQAFLVSQQRDDERGAAVGYNEQVRTCFACCLLLVFSVPVPYVTKSV